VAADHGALAPLLPLRTGGHRPPLFCVHSAGGLGWAYGGLLRHIDAARPVYALQARGLTAADRLPASLDEMATDYVQQIREMQPAGPYHLVGWSLGGNVAHEMAVRLRRQGERVALLAVLDAHPDPGTGPRRQPDEQEILRGLLGIYQHELPAADAADLTFAGVVEVFRREGSALAQLDEHHFVALKRNMLNSLDLVGAHVPSRFDGDLLLFIATRGRTGNLVTPEGWEPFVSGRIEAHRLDCEHQFIARPGPMAEIGAAIAARLDPPVPPQHP
jgi:nonribosomal peptide synthetase DhbF